jgi:hypothetical protein
MTRCQGKEQQSLAGQTTPKWGQLPMMRRLHPEVEAIISWEPDCSLQTMTAIATSLDPPQNQQWDTINQATPWPWLCNYVNLCLPPQFFLYLILKLTSVSQRWAEMVSLPLPVM